MLCMVINTPSKYLNTCVELITTDIRVVVGWEDGSGRMGDESGAFLTSVVFHFLTRVVDPDARKDEDKRERGHQKIRWLNSITDSMDMDSSNL